MNTDLIKSISSKINHEIIVSKFTQGNGLIKSQRVFRDKSHYFENTSVEKKEKIHISEFLELLMYITNDVIISKENYLKFFNNNLEKAADYIKTITHKSRSLKFQIMEVLEDKSLLCDYPNCMKFYAGLLKMNITMIVNNTYLSEHNAGFSKTIVIYYNDKLYDFSFNNSNSLPKYGKYLSEKLIHELNVNDLRLHATNLNILTKDKKKVDLVNDLVSAIETSS
jgi:hypothetical protein